MSKPILVINAGSSSVKFALYDHEPGCDPIAGKQGEVERIDDAPLLTIRSTSGAAIKEAEFSAAGHEAALAAILAWAIQSLGGRAIEAVGHRVVHGGRDFASPILVDDAILTRLTDFIPLAPLHQPHNLAPIEALRRIDPALPQVACFDTGFHRSQAAIVQAFALPQRWAEEGICRYGFHGLSYEYIASVLPDYLGADLARGRVIVAHLGNGASLCALKRGASVATTMGFTALEGLMMGTRCGSLDPGVVLYLQQHHGLSVGEVETLLYRQSGLLGVSGLSGDMRVLLASPLPAARQAIDLFVYRIVREIGAMAASLGGLDALVFTAGIGEHAAPIRAAAIEGSAWLGLTLDRAANDRHGPLISEHGPVTAWVIPTDENLMIARHTVAALSSASALS